MLYLPGSLKQAYGGPFPIHSELDHLMALRGMLVRWVQLKGISYQAKAEVSRAIDWVMEEITKESGKEFKDIPNASEALLDHYQNIVSQCLGWLYTLSTLLPAR